MEFRMLDNVTKGPPITDEILYEHRCPRKPEYTISFLWKKEYKLEREDGYRVTIPLKDMSLLHLGLRCWHLTHIYPHRDKVQEVMILSTDKNRPFSDDGLFIFSMSEVLAIAKVFVEAEFASGHVQKKRELTTETFKTETNEE